MATLASYITATQRLLHDSRFQFFTEAELTDYINEGRKRTVRDSGCYRVLVTAYVQEDQETYNFGGLTAVQVTAGGTGYLDSFAVTFTGGGGSGATATATASGGVIQSIAVTAQGTGYTSAPTVVLAAGGGSNGAATAYFLHENTLDVLNNTYYWGNSRVVMSYQPWTRFNARSRYYVNYFNRPAVGSVYNNRTVYMQPVPDQNYQMEWDTVRLPADMDADADSDAGVIPDPFTACPPFYAAYLAKMKEQSWGEAEKFMAHYRMQVLAALNSVYTRRMPNPYGG